MLKYVQSVYTTTAPFLCHILKLLRFKVLFDLLLQIFITCSRVLEAKIKCYFKNVAHFHQRQELVCGRRCHIEPISDSNSGVNNWFKNLCILHQQLTKNEDPNGRNLRSNINKIAAKLLPTQSVVITTRGTD